MDEQLAGRDADHFVDVCVIGAGAVGLTILSKLATHRNLKVLVLEAGGVEGLPDDHVSPVKNTGDVQTIVTDSYNCGLGGSTLSWGGQLLEFMHEDFETRSNVGNSGWPISYQTLSPYYDEVVQLLEADYIPFDADITKGLSQDVLMPQGLESRFSKWCPEKNFAHHFKKVIYQSPSAQVLLNAQVVKLVKAASVSGSDVLIEYSTEGASKLVRSRAVILAAGGLENYRLLARSKDISKNLPALGRCYHDHVGCYGAKLTPINPSLFNRLFSTKFRGRGKCVPKICFTEELLHKTQGTNVNGTLEVSTKDQCLLTHARSILAAIRNKATEKPLLASIKVLLTNIPELLRYAWNYVVHRQVYLPGGGEFFLIANCETTPQWGSCLSLEADSSDIDVDVSANWLVDDKPRLAMLEFYERVKQSLEEAEIAKVEIKPALYEDNDSWRSSAYTLYHHMGSTRMGDEKSMSVVDSDCQVHDQSNVYVAGCSVLPTGSCSNPTLTALALGMRLADHVCNLLEPRASEVANTEPA